MTSTKANWVVKSAGAGALALILAVPAFAQTRDNRSDRTDIRGSRDGGRSSRDGDRGRSNGTAYRDNQRVTAEGRISSFTRDRDGYRMQLDGRRDSYYVPQSRFGNNRIRVGLSVRLGGIFRGSTIYVDAVNLGDDRGRYDDSRGTELRGVVDRIDARNDTLWLRDARTRELVAVELRDTRSVRNDLRDIRRGDYVEVSGDWLRGGVFQAYDIDVR